MSDAGWVVVLPVKPLVAAKTRLRGAVPDTVHADLVLAMALDTLGAVTASPTVARVVVVSDDATVRAAVGALGAACLPDPPGGGLNAALDFGAAGVPGPVAALTADLPALRTADLTAALTAAGSAARPGAGGRAFVADAARTGTVLLTAARGTDLAARFGTRSAVAHRESGARELDGGWPSLRRDVDTAADLADAAALGVGPATRAIMDRLGTLAIGGIGPGPASSRSW